MALDQHAFGFLEALCQCGPCVCARGRGLVSLVRVGRREGGGWEKEWQRRTYFFAGAGHGGWMFERIVALGLWLWLWRVCVCALDTAVGSRYYATASKVCRNDRRGVNIECGSGGKQVGAFSGSKTSKWVWPELPGSRNKKYPICSPSTGVYINTLY